jgi:NAD(P)-dependent dehydrogenase (short-subunit alcohol dehydrogenase family)
MQSSQKKQHISPTSSPRLIDQVVLITGAGTGIGRSTASAFAREGATVVLAGRRQAELQQVAREIVASGGSAIAMPTDVSDASAVKTLINAILDRFGQLDAAFNNAGILGATKSIVELTPEDFDATMATNTRGVWLLMKYEIEAMLGLGHGGAIVNTSSFLSLAAGSGLSVYAASKAALDAMTRQLALEVGGQNIRINNINPGVIKTAMSHGAGEVVLAALAKHSGLKRLGEPEDIADVAVWLCTEESRYITGQSIFVDGGFAIPGMR